MTVFNTDICFITEPRLVYTLSTAVHLGGPNLNSSFFCETLYIASFFDSCMKQCDN